MTNGMEEWQRAHDEGIRNGPQPGSTAELEYKVARLRALLLDIAEFCSGDDRTLGAIARMAHIRNSIERALRDFT